MKKSFPIEAILGITTGRLMASFSDLHQLAEHLLGHPVWTHEFADRALQPKLKALAIAQHPQLAYVPDWADNGEPFDSYIPKFVATAKALIGSELEFESGNASRSEHPVESLIRIGQEVDGG